MGFASDSGYTPASIETMMLSVMENVNTQFGTSYTAETFIGTNFYKYFYALVQRLQLNEIKTSEIFLKLQQYIAITNERILRPVVTNPGLIEGLEAAGYIAAVKPVEDGDAGKIFIAVDKHMDDDSDWEDSAGYAADKLAVCTFIKNSTVAGAVTQGSETETIVLSNGQSFDFKYTLPERIPIKLRLTTTLSENNQVFIKAPEDIKADLIRNIKAKYTLGKDFEPQRYYSLIDAPWASKVLLEWSTDGGSTYYPDVFDAEYDDLYDYDLADISLVED